MEREVNGYILHFLKTIKRESDPISVFNSSLVRSFLSPGTGAPGLQGKPGGSEVPLLGLLGMRSLFFNLYFFGFWWDQVSLELSY